MIVVGELINTSRKKIAPLVDGRDEAAVQDLAQRQKDAGADYIDVNAGTFVEKEVAHMEWLVKTVQAKVDGPLSIDSPNPEAVAKGLALHKGTALVNSITAEKDRYQSIVPLVKEHGASVVALCMDDSGMPETADERFAVAEKLVGDLGDEGIAPERIFLDPLVRPVSTNPEYGAIVLNTIARIREELQGVHMICGLSNVSFGLPVRKLLNQNFFVLAMGRGLDAVIIDPLDKRIMSDLYATEALLGLDDYCMNFITKHREGAITL